MAHNHRTHERPRRDATGRLISPTTRTPYGDVTLASAALVTKRQFRTGTQRKTWQEEAWGMYDCIGEMRYAARWKANAISRAHLFIAKPSPEAGGDPEPVDSPPELAADLLDDLHSGQIGQGGMLRRMSLNLDIPGEFFLVGMDPDPEDGPDARRRWLVASNDEFSNSGGRVRVQDPATGEKIDLDPDTSTVIRIWDPHPRIGWEADSSIRANLPVLREIWAFGQHISATVRSRLAGPGILPIPSNSTIANPRQAQGSGVAPLHEDPLIDSLMTGMMTPIQDPDDPSAVVPLIMKIPPETIGKIGPISFWSDLTNHVTEMREAAIRRFAGGSDLPGEVITGMGDSSHWNAAEISDDAIGIHVEPTLACICDALTQQYLHPGLKAAGVKDWEQFVIWFDATEIAQRPDKSEQAQNLYDKGALSAGALLRENGFDEADAPDDDESVKQLVREIALLKPEIVVEQPALAEILGLPEMEPPIDPAAQQVDEDGNPIPPEEQAPGDQPPGEPPQGGSTKPSGPRPVNGRPTPAQRRSAGKAPNRPGKQAAQQAITAGGGDGWLITTVESVVLRALELAGKRILTNAPRAERYRASAARQVPAWSIHTIRTPDADPATLDKLLDGAFDTAPTLLAGQECIIGTLDGYCRRLLASGTEHHREHLIAELSEAGCIQQHAA